MTMCKPWLKSSFICVLLSALPMTALANSAQSVVEQWQQGLKGVKLTSYSGSVINANSTLTVINLCHDGRFSYYKEGSWSVTGLAGGASNSTITGRWSVEQRGYVMLTYVTDQSQQGAFPIYLQYNGKVNIGGVAYSAQRGAAGC